VSFWPGSTTDLIACPGTTNDVIVRWTAPSAGNVILAGNFGAPYGAETVYLKLTEPSRFDLENRDFR